MICRSSTRNDDDLQRTTLQVSRSGSGQSVRYLLPGPIKLAQEAKWSTLGLWAFRDPGPRFVSEVRMTAPSASVENQAAVQEQTTPRRSSLRLLAVVLLVVAVAAGFFVWRGCSPSRRPTTSLS